MRGQTVKKQELPGMTMGILPHDDGEVGACLLTSLEEKPSGRGPIIYLNGWLDDARAAVSAHGGTIIQPKHPIEPFGFCVVVRDSDGNRVALHSD